MIRSWGWGACGGINVLIRGQSCFSLSLLPPPSTYPLPPCENTEKRRPSTNPVDGLGFPLLFPAPPGLEVRKCSVNLCWRRGPERVEELEARPGDRGDRGTARCTPFRSIGGQSLEAQGGRGWGGPAG